MNKLSLILDKTNEIRELLDAEDFDQGILFSIREITEQIDEVISNVRDDGEFEFEPPLEEE